MNTVLYCCPVIRNPPCGAVGSGVGAYGNRQVRYQPPKTLLRLSSVLLFVPPPAVTGTTAIVASSPIT